MGLDLLTTFTQNHGIHDRFMTLILIITLVLIRYSQEYYYEYYSEDNYEYYYISITHFNLPKINNKQIQMNKNKAGRGQFCVIFKENGLLN